MNLQIHLQQIQLQIHLQWKDQPNVDEQLNFRGVPGLKLNMEARSQLISLSCLLQTNLSIRWY